MDPGTDLNRRHLAQISEFLETLAEVYSAALYSNITGSTKIYDLSFPASWRGLSLSIKYPMNTSSPDLDITVRSAVSEPTILSTKDEGVAKMFITSVLQMYEPKEERF